MVKYLLSACLLGAFLFAGCGGVAGNADCHAGQLTDSVKLPGITVTHMIDSFEVNNGQYRIFTMLKHTGKRRYKYLQLNASYLNGNGKQIAQSIGGPESELMPGDSAIVETHWLFPVRDSLPCKVILTVTNL